MSSLTLLLILCLSVHACNARFLSISGKETGQQYHLFTEDVNEAKLHKSPTQLGPGHSVSSDLKTQEVGNNERKIHENRDGENAMKREDSKTILKEEASKPVTSGNTVVHSPDDSQLLATPEGLKKSQARSMLGSSPDDTDEAIDTKENDVVEDIVAMDYAQPHRKPPIHNVKP